MLQVSTLIRRHTHRAGRRGHRTNSPRWSRDTQFDPSDQVPTRQLYYPGPHLPSPWMERRWNTPARVQWGRECAPTSARGPLTHRLPGVAIVFEVAQNPRIPTPCRLFHLQVSFGRSSGGAPSCRDLDEYACSLRALSLQARGANNLAFQVQGHDATSPKPDRVSDEAPGESNMSWTDDVYEWCCAVCEVRRMARYLRPLVMMVSLSFVFLWFSSPCCGDLPWYLTISE